MYTWIKAMSPRDLAKWLAYALFLLAPGSFVVLPLLALGRHLSARRARLATVTQQQVN